ncbi:MAG: hypothetical protein ACHQ1H_14990 [Nitrososphaerales archaeon]
MTEESKPITHECLSCGVEVIAPKSENMFGEEYICDSCRDQTMESLEEAWKKHSAFLDAALN